MSVNVFKTITSATKFVDFCKRLDNQGNLFDSDLEAIYSYADDNGYDVVLVDNYQYYARRFSMAGLFFTFLNADSLKDLAMEVGLSEDVINNVDDDDALYDLIESQVKDAFNQEDFIFTIQSFLPGDQSITPIPSDDDDCYFLVMKDSIFE